MVRNITSEFFAAQPGPDLPTAPLTWPPTTSLSSTRPTAGTAHLSVSRIGSAVSSPAPSTSSRAAGRPGGPGAARCVRSEGPLLAECLLGSVCWWAQGVAGPLTSPVGSFGSKVRHGSAGLCSMMRWMTSAPPTSSTSSWPPCQPTSSRQVRGTVGLGVGWLESPRPLTRVSCVPRPPHRCRQTATKTMCLRSSWVRTARSAWWWALSGAPRSPRPIKPGHPTPRPERPAPCLLGHADLSPHSAGHHQQPVAPAMMPNRCGGGAPLHTASAQHHGAGERHDQRAGAPSSGGGGVGRGTGWGEGEPGAGGGVGEGEQGGGWGGEGGTEPRWGGGGAPRPGGVGGPPSPSGAPGSGSPASQRRQWLLPLPAAAGRLALPGSPRPRSRGPPRG